jgi:hypothetical protein
LSTSDLGIYIPTVGGVRKSFIKELIASIENNISPYVNIKCYISFNGYPDGDLIAFLEKNRIEILRVGEDEGLENNIKRCVDNCSEEYCLVVGDDDVFLNGAGVVINDFIALKGDHLLMRHFMFDDDLGGTKNVDGKLNNSVLSYARVFDLENKIGFISSNVFRTRLLKEALALAVSTPLTYNSYLPKFYGAIVVSRGAVSLKSNHPVIAQRLLAEGKGSIFINSRSQYLEHFYFKIKNGYDYLYKEKAISCDFLKSFFNKRGLFVRLRGIELIGFDFYKSEILNNRNVTVFNRIFYFFIMILPPVFARFLRKNEFIKLKKMFPSLFLRLK